MRIIVRLPLISSVNIALICGFGKELCVIKKLLGNISFILLLNLLVKPIGLVVENLVQDRIGHEAYGLFSALFSLTALGAVLADLGISQLVTKKIAADKGFLDEYLPTALLVKLILVLFFPVLLVGLGTVLGHDANTIYLLAFIAFGFGLGQLLLFFRATFQGNQHFNIDAVGSVADKFLLAILVLLLLPWRLDLEKYVYARTVASGLAFVIFYWLVTRMYGRFKLRFNGLQLRTLLRQSLPFALITLVYGINERVDIVMLERLASAREAGLYAGPYRWIDAIMMYLWTILPIFFAKFALTIQARDEQQKLLRFGMVVISVPIIFISVFGLFYGEIFFFQFKNSTPAELATMTLNLRILLLSVLVHGFFAIFSTLLTSSNFEKPVSILVALSIVLNIGLNFMLIPEFGSLAAAFNTLVCAVFVSGGYFIAVGRGMKMELPFLLTAKLLLLTLALVGVFYLLTFGVEAWWLSAALAGLVYIGLVFGFRIVSLAELSQLLHRKKQN